VICDSVLCTIACTHAYTGGCARAAVSCDNMRRCLRSKSAPVENDLGDDSCLYVRRSALPPGECNCSSQYPEVVVNRPITWLRFHIPLMRGPGFALME
jgi:hypothetical protein